ncbi:MAG: PEP-CTERM sorting domain-containing protein [Acidobacteria bacterium]|nr:PEP-CTERM sorting domain-containing protein [Acidobacteriota bacterium]
MMKKYLLAFGALLLISVMSPFASATPYLEEWGINTDGTFTYFPAAPGGFDDWTGLGIWTETISTAGPHSVIAYFDHELSQELNTFYNEFGTIENLGSLGGNSNIPGAVQSFEIDEPQWGNPVTGYYGDIIDNFEFYGLDNDNMLSYYEVFPGGLEDISMAMGWDFTLNAGETAIVKFTLSDTAPTGGFYLQQTDDNSGENIFFSSELTKRGDFEPIPEPSTIILVLSGLGLAAVARFRKSA